MESSGNETHKTEFEVPFDNETLTDIEPGACKESMLVTTDSFEEFVSEMSTSIVDRKLSVTTNGTISEIQEGIQELDVNSEPNTSDESVKTVDVKTEDVSKCLMLLSQVDAPHSLFSFQNDVFSSLIY